MGADLNDESPLIEEITRAARAFVTMVSDQPNIDGRGSLCHLFGCVGGLSLATCECGWVDLLWAVKRMDGWEELSALRSMIDHFDATERTPEKLRELLADGGWRRSL